MPNEQNLIPIEEVNSRRSREEHSEDSRKGGIASGVSRRRKRSLKEAADLFLSLPVADQRAWNKIAKSGVDPEDIDNQMAIIIGLTTKAVKGDAKAAKVIIDLLGENPGEEKNKDGMLADLIDGLIEDDVYTETERFDEGLAGGEAETD